MREIFVVIEHTFCILILVVVTQIYAYDKIVENYVHTHKGMNVKLMKSK